MENETITFDDFWIKFIGIAERNQNYDKLQAKAIWYSLTKLEQENAMDDLTEIEDFSLGRILIEPFKFLLIHKND